MIVRPSRRALLASALALVTAMLPLRCAVAADARPALPRGLWRWAVDYGPMPDPAIARTVDILVVEPDHAGATPVTRGSGPLLLAYLSLGEVAASRPYAARLRADGLLGRRNPHWPEASYIDLRDPRWRRMVLERIIPPLVARGFDGIFFDTLDNAEAMEAADPDGAAGMVAAAAALVEAIRQRFPRLLLMMNRGYAMLPTVAPHIDLLLGEAMASRWNFATKRYEKLSDADWTWQADRLRAARDVNPALALLTLDYWSMDDPATVRTLYARERAAGFVPYVSMLALDRLYAEPE